ncbi:MULTISPECIES: DUF2178 domain-containing protein [Dehalococcoides]|jgi:uncharacterized membrane protein|uniref:DUF2178 domain-containing protein n=1 Tax=Dehalococcoides TaxID=61434 RepID=UPI0003C85D51|nr:MULTISPECIES: DUF2178 domain-containing protein [Dehalococcoides]AHB13945.1 putative membrane protein [Dehalococcoides mccartyi GY50]AII58290.1 hypothetical protein X792_06255 [Dehalococcoides mccartyi CG1]APH12866.1 hypothetical protein ASJ33_06710 [Dehalococcoides mccartyi]QYY57713.1 DUF2178 domain-containing protein [Dehalococcoides mccartyi]BAQ35058.1 putative membrane protein [Dehalococcoides sp. UCH007]
MSIKAYRYIVISLSVAIGSIVGWAAINEWYLVGLLAVPLLIGMSIFLRSQVRGVLADERQYRIQEKAASFTIRIFGPVVGIAPLIYLMINENAASSPEYWLLVGMAIFFILLYDLANLYYRSKM